MGLELLSTDLPQVQFHDTVNDTWKWKRQAVRPAWWDREDNIVHVGTEGDHHVDLVKAIPDETLKAAFGEKSIGMPAAQGRYLPLLMNNQGAQYDLSNVTRSGTHLDLSPIHQALSQHLPMAPYEAPRDLGDSDEWDFKTSDYQNPNQWPGEQLKFEGMPPTFRTEMEDEDPDDFQNYKDDRHPFIYDSTTNTFYMGMHGKLHSDTARYYDIPYRNTGALWTEPDGSYKPSVTDYYAPNMPPEAEQALRQKYGVPDEEPPPAEDEWSFGSKVFSERQPGILHKSADSEPWEQDGYMIHEMPEDVPVNTWGIKGSRPVIHHDRDIYVGKPGHFHNGLLNGFPHLQNVPPGMRNHGWIDEEGVGGRGGGQSGVGWYDEPDDRGQIDQALSKAYGFDLNAPQEVDPDEFTFSRIAALHHDLEWMPGERGKGWVLEDGSVWTWNIGEDGKPFHLFKNFQMKQRGINPMRIPADNMYGSLSGAFEIDADGAVHRLGKPVDGEFLDHIRNAEPRLHVAEHEADEFTY